MDLDAIISAQKHTIDGLRAELARVTAERDALSKEEAESRHMFYREQDKRQSAEYRVEELVKGLTDFATSSDPFIAGIAKSIISRAESATCQKATNPSQISSEPATPGLRTDNPMAEPVMGGLPRHEGERLGTPAKHPDTVILDSFEAMHGSLEYCDADEAPSHWRAYGYAGSPDGIGRTLRDAMAAAARKQGGTP